jgi:hypothetical protein
VKSKSHLRLVPDPEQDNAGRGLLSGPPWTWIGLATATLIVPVAHAVADALSIYERSDEELEGELDWSEVAERR